MRAPPLIARVRHFGVRAYEHASHFSAGLNTAVETGAQLYGGIIQSLLRSLGVDTRDADSVLMDGYSKFDSARAVVQRIDGIIQR